MKYDLLRQQKCFVTREQWGYIDPFLFEKEEDITKATVILFTGGNDVYPPLYGEDICLATSTDDGTMDAKEKEAFDHAIANKIPMIGICRGSQFLTVMAGGKLFQDVTHHAIAGTHKISFDSMAKNDLEITSTHHQMMNPFEIENEDDYELIAWANSLSNYYMNGDNKMVPVHNLYKDFVEPEIVYYKKINALAIQGHPEYMEADHKTVDYLRELVMDKIL